MITAEQLRDNINFVMEKVESALAKSHRDAHSVKIIAVSKAVTVTQIEEAIDAGLYYFGENYPEETEEKIKQLTVTKNIEWHMIGHLQSRKIKHIVNLFHWYHSLDRLDIAEKLNSKLASENKVLSTLIELNIAGEETKSGWSTTNSADIHDLYRDLEIILGYQNIQIRGLMTMPPLSSTPEKNDDYFKKQVEIKSTLQMKYPQISWDELSMGTSGDYPYAIQAGATMVRLGQAIFGPRIYN